MSTQNTNKSKAYEIDLSAMDTSVRKSALDMLRAEAAAIDQASPAADQPGNTHAHTFFSFNCYGYSPAHYALLARRHGMEVAGIVDFDVLDGMEEFHTYGALLNLRTVVSLESRVYVESFSSREINSPGEPGIAYHMATGFARLPESAEAQGFLEEFARQSEQRNREVIARVNAVLDPVCLSYEDDVLPLTPQRNATERHITLAYARKAATLMQGEDLQNYWARILGGEVSAGELPESAGLLNRIRARTMKKGGAGYVAPTATSFPPLAAFNRFAVACGALPTAAWLDGTTAGEAAMDEWFTTTGACMLNIIPDRNFKPGVKDQKLANLYAVVDWAERHHWPVIVGTEMNAHGQKFVDAFETAELKPLVPVFMRGARILYAHTALQRAGRFGYLGDWADTHLPDRAKRNAFFDTLGSKLSPALEARLMGITAATTPAAVLSRLA